MLLTNRVETAHSGADNRPTAVRVTTQRLDPAGAFHRLVCSHGGHLDKAVGSADLFGPNSVLTSRSSTGRDRPKGPGPAGPAKTALPRYHTR